MLDYRDWLASTQDPEVKPQQREFRGRDGRIKITDDGRLRYRTYTLTFPKRCCAVIGSAKAIQEHDSDFRLISMDELCGIRRIWLMERQDWSDSMPEIYQEVTGQTIAWDQNDAYAPGKLEADLLAELGDTHNVPQQLVQKLLDAEWQHYGISRRATIHKTVEKIFNED
ncbi:MAG: hypothetical protein R2911_34910 [Caldilineaceae bacterium]